MKSNHSTLSVLAIIICLFGCSVSGLAQEKTPPPTNTVQSAKADSENLARESQDRLNNKQARENGDKFMRDVKDSRTFRADSKTVLSEDLLFSNERKLLEPSIEDRQQYSTLLSQPGTGIFKLLVEERSTANGAVSVEELKDKKPVLSLFGGGSFYSFTKRKHDLNDWVDIAIINGSLKSGLTGKSLGVMTIIGDVPLELIKPESYGVAHLAKLAPPTDFSAAAKQFAQNTTGYESEGMIYKSTMPIVLNQAYVLRSTLYQRGDLLIAFRIIRQDKDGALTIVWKKLNSYPVSKLTNLPKEKQLWLAGR